MTGHDRSETTDRRHRRRVRPRGATAPVRSGRTRGWSRTCTTATGPIPPRSPTRGGSSSPTTGRPAGRRPPSSTSAPAAPLVTSSPAPAGTVAPARRPAASPSAQPAAPPSAAPAGAPALAGNQADEPPAVPAPGRGRSDRGQHGGVARGSHRHQRARRPGQAARGQPHHHQQPAVPDHRRQGQLHPPDRLRRGQGPRWPSRP